VRPLIRLPVRGVPDQALGIERPHDFAAADTGSEPPRHCRKAGLAGLPGVLAIDVP
jgi:hypothetical protein